jgi:hypothetical protein
MLFPHCPASPVMLAKFFFLFAWVELSGFEVAEQFNYSTLGLDYHKM